MLRKTISGRNVMRFAAVLGVFVALALGYSAHDASAVGGSITGTVFDDLNNDGVMSSEVGHNAVVVYLDINGNGALDGGDVSTTTDASGNYSFSNVADATYNVRVIAPSGYGVTTSNPLSVIVSGGSNITNANVGVSNVGSVSGYVFDDANADGIMGVSDAGLSGKVVFVDTNGNGAQNLGEPTATTDSNGFYRLTGLVAGTNATVRLTSVPATAMRTTAIPGASSVTAGMVQSQNIGLFTYASVSGTIFDDTNGDGIKQVGEVGINGRTVYCDANANNIRDAGEPYSTTSPSGVYTITGLTVGTCSPRLVSPTSVQTSPNPADVVITSGLTATGVDFASFTYGTLSGYVFNDINADGIKQAGDTGLTNKTVFLDANNDGTLNNGELSTITNATGQFSFSGIGPGTQIVRAAALAGNTETTAASYSFNYQSGQSYSGSFGFFANASISGEVYDDSNGNGMITPGESGTSGKTVYIDANANDVFDVGEVSTTSDIVGNYAFTGLGPGTYRIRVDAPSGWTRTSANPTPVAVTSGGNPTFNFGLFKYVSISGTVFEDVNGDGSAQAGDNGWGGLTVFLDANANGSLDVSEQSTTTLFDGSFSFSGITSGSYRPRLIMPGGLTLTTGQPASISATSGLVSTSTTFGLFTNISISGTIFNDVNGDGIKQSGDNGMSGRTVYLDLNGNGLLGAGEPSTLTDATGAFSFNNLGPNTYRVRSNITSGLVQSSTAPSDILARTGTNVAAQDIGFFATGSVSGMLFNDVNGNGLKDGSETGLSGRTIFLDANSNGVLDGGELSTTTAAGGVYSIPNVGAGTYRVLPVLVANVSLTTALPAPFTTTSGYFSGGNDFGIFLTGTINGLVYEDLNGNGAKAAGEPGVAGRTVYLDLDNSGTLDVGEPTATTSASGTYSFPNLSAGTYTVRLVGVAGNQQTTTDPSPILVGSNTNAANVNFGVFSLMSISGSVFMDVNGNGIVNAPEDVALPGYTVYLDTNNNGVADVGETSTTTDSSGVYTFTSVPAGSYRVRVSYPSSMLQTTTLLPTIAASSGLNSTGSLMGLFGYGSFSGTVFSDDSGNGIRDGGEAGISGVRVYSDTNGNGVYNNGEPTTSTDINGNYTLSSLKVGAYRVRAVLGLNQILNTALPADVSVQSGTSQSGVDFGFFTQASITGTIFVDENGNKVRDAGEDVSGPKTVFIDDNGNGKLDAGEKSAQSKTGGAYVITGLSVGPYTVRIILVPGLEQSTDLPGPISLHSGQTANADFGYVDHTKPVGAGAPGSGTSAPLPDDAPHDAYSANSGYWMASSEGGVFSYGNAQFYGSAVPYKPNRPIVSLAPMPTNKGYYLVADDGGIFAFGDAQFFGSMGGSPLNKPMVGMAVTPSGKGYWTVATDGGIFSYGDAKFYGSTGSIKLNKPIVGMQSTPSGNGYWLVASDGGIFAYGDAQFYGSTGSIKLNQPIVAMARAKDGFGYWLVAADGGVFAYGNAAFLGSTGDRKLTGPIVDVRATYNGDGYWMFGNDGGVYAFGASKKYGERPKSRTPIVS